MARNTGATATTLTALSSTSCVEECFTGKKTTQDIPAIAPSPAQLNIFCSVSTAWAPGCRYHPGDGRLQCVRVFLRVWLWLIVWLCAHRAGPFCVQLHQLSRPCTHHAVSVVSLVTYGADSDSRQWCCPAFHAPPAWKVLAAATCSPAMIKQQVVTMHITISQFK